PSRKQVDGWIAPSYQFDRETGVIYAQTFVSSPSDVDALLSVGVNGALKVWVNDAIKIAEETEHATELDYNTVKVKLNKGFNRVLIQLSFTNKNYPNF